MPDTAPTTADTRIGANVAGQLRRHKVRQHEAAAELGISRQALAQRLNGNVAFRASELDALALMLGEPVTAFYADLRAPLGAA